jgi:hypothetical protein
MYLYVSMYVYIYLLHETIFKETNGFAGQKIPINRLQVVHAVGFNATRDEIRCVYYIIACNSTNFRHEITKVRKLPLTRQNTLCNRYVVIFVR